MLQLYTRRTYGPIRQLLRSQGLIGEIQEREIEQRVSAVQLNNVGVSTILDSISDTFVIQLPTTTLSLAFIHDECIVPSIRMAHILSWGDRPEAVEGSDAARWRAYQGAALVRFELRKAGSNRVFRSAKEGELVLVLRILELLDPPLGPDGVPFRLPEGGDLAQGKSPGRYWCMSLDRAQKLGIFTPSSLKILGELYLGDISTSAETTTTKSPSS
ncbi:hypothetical protein D9611_010586 [Ephemerocybe angulata]|uniref:Uncharacterized protein n=1 Tax=Ephemerocybe angulata TaxID=980116 RepID=A0A8H5BW00_9AGAR|nr:hypothetical protein D9611_010586 [Tulosesus angulatus]